MTVNTRWTPTNSPTPAYRRASSLPEAGSSVTQAPSPQDGFHRDSIPSDDDAPVQPAPQQEPVEGPGAGGGYDGDEIPADDDGPGAGGGYDQVEQEPAESDGPGAGGGYLQGSSLLLQPSWNRPLALFHEPSWGALTCTSNDLHSWSTSGNLEPLLFDAQGRVVATRRRGEVH